MQVRMKVCRAGFDFVHNPGDVVDVSADEAARMIEAKHAEPHTVAPGKKRGRPAKAKGDDVETASADDGDDVESPESPDTNPVSA